MSGGLGRRVPKDFDHVANYRLATLIADPASPLVVPPLGVEKSLGLPSWWRKFDQGTEGQCVGFGASAMMSITNSRQAWKATGRVQTFRYMPSWLYTEAQLVDEWGDTPPGEGTSVKAGCDILRNVGHRRVVHRVSLAPDAAQGIAANRWATTVDEMRAAIFADLAVAIGVNWYSNFDSPVLVKNERWVGQSALGNIRGGHCVCVYRMSDRRQAFAFINSWGDAYAPAWVPYSVMQRLLDEEGEAAVIVDR